MHHLVPYVLGTIFVLSIGVAAYWMNTSERQDHGDDTKSRKREDLLEWRSQLLGWISALLYCGYSQQHDRLYMLLILLFRVRSGVTYSANM